MPQMNLGKNREPDSGKCAAQLFFLWQQERPWSSVHSGASRRIQFFGKIFENFVLQVRERNTTCRNLFEKMNLFDSLFLNIDLKGNSHENLKKS